MKRPLLIALATLLPVVLGVVAWEAAQSAPATQAKPQVLILIDAPARTELGSLLDRYRQDALASLTPTYGATLRVEVRSIDLVSYFPQGTVDEAGQNRLTVDVARDLRTRYHNDGLVGIVVVGAIPLPRAYDAGVARLTLYPWMDFEAPGFVEERGRFVRSAETNPRPEVWSGVIRVPANAFPAQTFLGTSVARSAPTLRSYFEKNHGQRTAPRRFLYNDLAGEDALRGIPGSMPGGSEVALRAVASRFAERLVSAGRYDGVNYADAQLPKGRDDQTKTVKELLAKADGGEISRWKNGSGALKQIDVASQVILYADRVAEMDVNRLNAARDAARTIVTREGFDLFARGGYEFCADRAPEGGNGYFSLVEAQRAQIAARSGFGSRPEFETLLRWAKVYTDGEKRLSLVRDGIPRIGKYRALDPTGEVRFTIAPGSTAYEVRGARMDGACLQAGPANSGGLVEILLGAATAREAGGELPASIALWATARGTTLAAYGNVSTPGFGRLANVSGTAEGIGFESDPFLLGILSGQPLGEAFRPSFDEPSVLYGDPTLHLP